MGRAGVDEVSRTKLFEAAQPLKRRRIYEHPLQFVDVDDLMDWVRYRLGWT